MKRTIPLLIAMSLAMASQGTPWQPQCANNVASDLQIDCTLDHNLSLAPFYEMPEQMDDDDTKTIYIEAANYPDMSYYFLGVFCITPEKEVFKVQLDGDYKATLKVKAGESYDFVGHYWGCAVSFLYLSAEYFDIKEGIVANDDETVVKISPENCTLTLKPRATAPDNQPWELNRDLSGWGGYDESGNATAMWGTLCLSYENTSVCGSLMQQIYAPIGEGYETSMDLFNIHVPPFSSLFTFSLGIETLAKSYTNYFDIYEFNGAQEDIVLENSGEDYQMYSEGFDYSINTGSDLYYSGVISDMYVDEKFYNGWSNNGNIPIEKDQPVEFCVNKKNDEYKAAYLLTPLYVELLEKEGSYKSFPMYGAPMNVHTPDHTPHYVIKNGSLYSNMAFENPNSDPVVSSFEGHPFFSYEAWQRNGNYGSMTPICSIDYNPDAFYNYIDIRYLGPYGENRTCDLINMEVVTSTDGEVNSEVTDYFTLENYRFYINEKHTLQLFDRAISVDGIEGFNECRIEFDLSKENKTPPSLRMLQIRNSSNEITNVLKDPEDGTIYFAAADIEILDNVVSFLEPTNISLEYAAFDSDVFYPLIVEKIADEYYANYGYTYKAALSDINQVSSCQWYKLRISLEDEGGNMMTQTFGPAFKLNNATGMNAIEAMDEESIHYYNLQGMPVTQPQKGQIVIRKGGERPQKMKW